MTAQTYTHSLQADAILPDLYEAALRPEAKTVLTHLREKNTVMALANEMENAIVVRTSTIGGLERIAVVQRRVAEFIITSAWVVPRQKGRITRYSLTATGWAALVAMREEKRKTVFAGAADTRVGLNADKDTSARRRFSTQAESPLKKLARRRDKDGQPLLENDLVAAGERLREDFELAKIEQKFEQGKETSLSPGQCGEEQVLSAPADYSKRVSGALDDLGPELSEVVVRCCCNLEGIESVERLFGWPARSGRVVLRIALIHLKRHYDETKATDGSLIG
jgi:hypothetical protein